jgi:NADPH2:quinone reductase
VRIEMSEYGGPEVLRVVEAQPEAPGPGQVRIHVAAAGVNRADLFIRSGVWPQGGDWPYVPGLELVGTIEAVGDGCRMSIGDRVITMMQQLGGIHGVRPGGYQRHAVVPESTLAILPRSLSRMDAATLGLPAVTAWMSLQALDVRAGQRVLVQAGSSAVGQLALRLLRAFGCESVATGTRPEKFDAMRAAGADDVIWTADPENPEWWRGHAHVDRVLELVGAPTFHGSLQMLSAGGRLVLAGATGGDQLAFEAWELTRPKTLLGYSSETLTRQQLQDAIDTLSRFVERDLVPLPQANVFPMADAAEAHRQMEAGALVGRVLLTP